MTLRHMKIFLAVCSSGCSVTAAAKELFMSQPSVTIAIRDIEEYKSISPALYDILKPQNINSLVVGPMYINKKRIGYYGVDNPPYKNMECISYTYDMLGNFIGSLIRARDFRRRCN